MADPHNGAMERLAINRVSAAAFTIPTDHPEADGTLAWDSTTLVAAFVDCAGTTGLGYTYSDRAAALLINDKLGTIVAGRDPLAIAEISAAMQAAVRNIGRCGIAAAAISAVDFALWDLKAKLLERPLIDLLGAVRNGVTVYGSGGFTSYPFDRLQNQLAGWTAQGIDRVKMKVGSQPAEDPQRVRAARQAIGPAAGLMVDANSAYSRKQALAAAERFAEDDVVWFEEPVTSDDLDGLRLLRDRAPAAMETAAGEYGYNLTDARRMLQADAVDVLQADATRCLGPSGFLAIAELCRAFGLPLSAHTAPSLHLHLCCAAPAARDIEYFHDHARIEHMLFDGAATPENGVIRPDLSRPGLGLAFKEADARRFAS